jgi:hypothetical protein
MIQTGQIDPKRFLLAEKTTRIMKPSNLGEIMGPLLPVVKFGVATLANIPVAKIANDIIKNNVTIVTKMDKIKVVTGSLVIGAMINQQISKTTDALVDTVVAIKNRTGNTEETAEIEEV